MINKTFNQRMLIKESKHYIHYKEVNATINQINQIEEALSNLHKVKINLGREVQDFIMGGTIAYYLDNLLFNNDSNIKYAVIEIDLENISMKTFISDSPIQGDINILITGIEIKERWNELKETLGPTDIHIEAVKFKEKIMFELEDVFYTEMEDEIHLTEKHLREAYKELNALLIDIWYKEHKR